MNRLLIWIAVGVASICVPTTHPAQTPAEESIKVATDLITVPVTVLARDGHYVTGLKREDFAVFEGGAEQKIEYFVTSEVPVSVLLLVDTSGSMGEFTKQLSKAVSAFINGLQPDDKVAIADFAERPRMIVPLTNASELKSTVFKIEPGGGTYIYEAVAFALRNFEQIKGRKAIVMFTDGLSNEFRENAESNLRDVVETDSLIYTVRFGTVKGYPIVARIPPVHTADTDRPFGRLPPPTSHDPASPALTRTGISEKDAARLNEKTDAYLGGLSSLSGGRSFKIDKVDDLQAAFADVILEMSQQYMLGYYSSKPGLKSEKRSLKVRTNAPGTSVRARKEIVF